MYVETARKQTCELVPPPPIKASPLMDPKELPDEFRDRSHWLRLVRETNGDGETQESLRREKALLQELIESIPDGVLIVSPEGQILYFNDHFLRIWRIPSEVVNTKSDEEALAWAAQQIADPERFLMRVAEVYGDPHHSPIHEELLMKDGRVLDRFGTPVRRNGIHYGWLWTFRDITARKKAEAALRESQQNLLQLSQSLEKRVEERTRALEEQSRRLRSLAAELASAEHRERKRLAALLHDDLQQLLAATSMRLGSVGHRLHEQWERDQLAQAMEWVNTAVTAARELTHELRPPALYEAGLVPALHWLASRMQKRHGLQVEVIDGAGLPRLGDDYNALLFDCVREMLFNVVKHAGVSEATVSVFGDAEWLRVVVEDHGRGFSPEATVGERPEGGFGLFSIRERMVGLGGAMVIEPVRPHGIRIELEIPMEVARAEPLPNEARPSGSRLAEVEQEKEQPAGKNGRLRVLVVDDHAIVRQGIASVLGTDERIEVVGQAGDGLEALELIEQVRPDLVVMDLNMPRMNGIEATQEIRRRWPNIVVVGLSVQDDEGTERAVLAAGAQAFLPKSGDSGRMISVITGFRREHAD